MKKYLTYLGLSLAIAALSSCNKTDWKETVNTGVSFRASSMSINFGANYLEIDTLYIEIGNFSLAGNRLQAEDIYLTNSTVVNGNFTGTDTELNLSFDVPQGTYESMQLTMKFNGSSALKMRGSYHQANGMIKQVYMEIESDESIVKSILEAGSPSVLIDKNNPGKIKILLDPEELFSGLNPGIWNASNPSTVGGQDAIEISNANNGNMHDLIKNKINSSISYNFE